LTNRILINGQRNDVNEHALFVADLYTVLPGEQLAGGRSLGQMFGALEAGGLTPGLLGGLYVDYGENSIFFFLVLGLLLAWCLRRACVHARFVPLYVSLLIQAAHLFHRGFLKPEYVTAMFIAAAYAFMTHSVRRPLT
jgi:hypothetical protein